VLGNRGFVVAESSTSSSDEFVWTSTNDDMINLLANWVFFANVKMLLKIREQDHNAGKKDPRLQLGQYNFWSQI